MHRKKKEKLATFFYGVGRSGERRIKRAKVLWLSTKKMATGS